MTTIRHDLSARCAPERLWALLSDLEAVATYNPTVESAALTGDQSKGIGAQRVCRLRPKGRVVERVTEWQEGEAVGLEVVESDWPLHYMRWTTRIEARAGGSGLTQVLDYAPKFGLLGWLLDRLVLRRKLRTTLDGVLAALVRKAEGG